MKIAALVTSLLLVAAVLPVEAQTADGSAAARKTRVAVLDFDYATVHNNVSAIFGSNVDVGKGVTDLLVTYLVKDGSYSVIERKALDKILAEQNFSNSERADASSAAKIGKLLGVDAMILGSDEWITLADLPRSVPREASDLPVMGDNLKEAARSYEKIHIENVLRRTGYDKRKAAELLGLGLSSLYRKIDELRIPLNG